MTDPAPGWRGPASDRPDDTADPWRQPRYPGAADAVPPSPADDRPPAEPAAGAAAHAAAHDRGPRPRRARLSRAAAVAVAAGWLALDQATKAWAVVALADRSVDLGLIELNLVRNPHGAFGLPGFPGMFVIASLLVLALLGRALQRCDRLGLGLAYGLVAGGALGNLLDRLLRAPGFPAGAVVDFLDLGWWPVFNVADVGIVTGALLIGVLGPFRDRAGDGGDEADGHAPGPPAGADAAGEEHPDRWPATDAPRGAAGDEDELADGDRRSGAERCR